MSARDVGERLRKRRTIRKITTDDGAIHVRSLSGTERKHWIQAFRGENGQDASFIDQYLVAMAWCDEAGSAVHDSFEDAFAVVRDWDIPTVVSPAAKAVLEMSGMAEKSVEDTEKKSEASQS